MKREVKIQENWKSIEEVRDQLRTHLGDESGDFDHILSLSASNPGSHIVLRFLWNQTNRKGEKQKKQEITNIIVRFCPFSGLPLYREEEVQTEQP